MKKIILSLFMGLMNLSSYAYDTNSAVKSSVENGRYEIVQSEIARKLTFKLDKYTGKVYQYVKTSSDSNPYSWQPVYWIGCSDEKEIPTKINYQLFLGGTAVSDCFLLNINTGKTWLLYEDSDGNGNFFSPIYE